MAFTQVISSWLERQISLIQGGAQNHPAYALAAGLPNVIERGKFPKRASGLPNVDCVAKDIIALEQADLNTQFRVFGSLRFIHSSTESK